MPLESVLHPGDILLTDAKINQILPPEVKYTFNYKEYMDRKGIRFTLFVRSGQFARYGYEKPPIIHHYSYLARNSVTSLLKDHFDYSTATYSSSFNHSTIKNDINYDRPVLFNATDEYVSSYKHTWVCTGWKEYIYYDDDCNSWSSMSYYMLWGQGTTDVGWYNWGSFNAGGYYLNDDLSMIYNIKP